MHAVFCVKARSAITEPKSRAEEDAQIDAKSRIKPLVAAP
jgi:hypothetical protein